MKSSTQKLIRIARQLTAMIDSLAPASEVSRWRASCARRLKEKVKAK